MSFGGNVILCDGLISLGRNSNTETDNLGIRKFSIFDITGSCISNISIQNVNINLIIFLNLLGNWLQLL